GGRARAPAAAADVIGLRGLPRGSARVRREARAALAGPMSDRGGPPPAGGPAAAGGPSGGWSAERLGPRSGSPLVVFIHGGFWRERGDASTIREIARRCATELGVSAWNLEYPRIGMDGGGWPGTGEAVRAAA